MQTLILIFGIVIWIFAIAMSVSGVKEQNKWEKSIDDSIENDARQLGFTPKDEGYVERPYGYTPNPFVNAEIARKMFLPDEEEERG